MTQDPLIGTQLANFRVLRLLKRGGMARVYYGRDVKLERPVAIKVIDFEYRDDPDYAERFVREARTIASWRHENIVQIYYADDQDGLYYFCMEYIDGVDLGELLDQYRQAGQLVPHGEVLRIGRAIAGALDYAHEQGLIHRDVKPSNVMIAGDKRVVLADFGLALDVHRGTMGHVFGSTHYIAPEQAKSSAAAVPQSDLYSLGVILYQMLTGMVPFDDPSPTTVALQHCTDSPPPPQEVNPDLSDEIEAVLIKALSKKPEDRYPTGAALIDAMTQVLDVSDTAPPLEVDSSSRLEPPVRLDTSLLGLQLDEYRLESLLGQGGMARVYCGVDVNLDRRVAIKVIDTPFRSDPDYVTRFRREAQAIAKLEHPHIVRLYRYGQAEDLLYMAMQFVDGADLGSVLSGYQQDKAYMDPKNASHIIREICEALDYAHQQGVIHRDVKPSNVMLDKQGHAILTDFGLALLTEFGTRGQIFGSPHYVAPEQAISSANVVPQSDLYAIGVILYEIFTGQLPFDAPDPIDIAMLHMSEPPTPPSQLRPEIGVELEAVILKLLEKTPDARYQSGAEVADALDQALGLGESRSIAVPLDAMPVQPVVSQRDTQPLPAIAQNRAAKAADAEDAQMPGRSSDRQSDSLALPPIPAAVVEPAAAGQTPPGPPAAGEGDSTTVETVADPPSSVLKKPRVRPSSRRVITTALIVLSACLLSTILTLTGYLILSGKGAILLEALQNPLPTPTGTAEPTATTAAMATPRPTRITKSVSAAAVATHTPAATATATPTRPPTETVTAAPTHTPAQAATHTPGPTATPTRTPVSYQLLLVAEKEDSLFVVNAGDTDFPLAGLLLSNNEGEVSGTAWAYAPLGPGECVALWKDNDDAKAPKRLACDQVGSRLEREGKERFWKKKFDVYYEDEQVGSCDKTPKECTVTFEGMP